MAGAVRVNISHFFSDTEKRYAQRLYAESGTIDVNGCLAITGIRDMRAATRGCSGVRIGEIRGSTRTHELVRVMIFASVPKRRRGVDDVPSHETK